MSLWHINILLDIKPRQARYYGFWLKALVVAEGTMLVFNRYLFEVYACIALAFFLGFILRWIHLYPGEDEPLILDFSGVFVAICFAFLGRCFMASGWRFVLILCSSLIILPHLIYIKCEK